MDLILRLEELESDSMKEEVNERISKKLLFLQQVLDHICFIDLVVESCPPILSHNRFQNMPKTPDTAASQMELAHCSASFLFKYVPQCISVAVVEKK
jgi:hypothetical protein